MKIVLVSVDEKLTFAWNKLCGDLDFVEVHHGDIFEKSCEALVSPANSFGFMDGGIDFLYSKKMGWHVQAILQKVIREQFDNELLIGQAALVQTSFTQFPNLIAAPTMRVPMKLPKNTVNPYLAAKAALICAKKHNIQSIAIPGLGTGIGEVLPAMCALQVRQAIDEIILGETKFPEVWSAALDQHTYLYTGLRTRPQMIGIAEEQAMASFIAKNS